jgi:hypothetical protein
MVMKASNAFNATVGRSTHTTWASQLLDTNQTKWAILKIAQVFATAATFVAPAAVYHRTHNRKFALLSVLATPTIALTVAHIAKNLIYGTGSMLAKGASCLFSGKGCSPSQDKPVPKAPEVDGPTNPEPTPSSGKEEN